MAQLRQILRVVSGNSPVVGHIEHTVEPATAYVDGEQSVQWNLELLSVSFLYFPALHFEQ